MEKKKMIGNPVWSQCVVFGGAGPLEEENGGETMMTRYPLYTHMPGVQLGVNWISTARVYGFGHNSREKH